LIKERRKPRGKGEDSIVKVADKDRQLKPAAQDRRFSGGGGNKGKKECDLGKKRLVTYGSSINDE